MIMIGWHFHFRNGENRGNTKIDICGLILHHLLQQVLMRKSHDQVLHHGMKCLHSHYRQALFNEAGLIHTLPNDERTHSLGSVPFEMTSASTRMSITVLPAVPPPMHPDQHERDEQDKSRRYSSVLVHSGKSSKSAGSTNRAPQPAPGPVDTRSFDSVLCRWCHLRTVVQAR